MRVKGKGLVTRQGRGDLYAVLKVVMPDKDNDRTRELWQQLAGEAAFDPREQWRASA